MWSPLNPKEPRGGTLLPPAMTAQDAFVRGMKGESSKAVFRRVVGQVMSLIYFPFWIVTASADGRDVRQIVPAFR